MFASHESRERSYGHVLDKEVETSTILRSDNFTSLSPNKLAEHLYLSAFFLCFRIHEATTSFLAIASMALLPQKLSCKPFTTKNPQHWTEGKSFLGRRADGEGWLSPMRLSLILKHVTKIASK